jgi:lipopolysaccharide biosynthesis glycosyltransferase
MLTSLRRAVPEDRPLRLLLLHARLPDEHLAAVRSVLETTVVPVPPPLLAAIPAHRHFPPEAAMPLLLGELVPDDVERVLFLDADLLVLDDPTELLDTSLEGRALGAVVDGAIARCSAPRGVRAWREQGIPAFAPYFNAGVMVISLSDWRAREIGARALRHLAGGGPTGRGFLHQEALNAVAWDDWHELDGRWNVLASHAGRRYSPSPAPERSGIVHFAGRMKPWRGDVGGPYASTYRAVLDDVAPLLPPWGPRPRDRVLSAYDRHLRERLFPLERALWKRGLIR